MALSDLIGQPRVIAVLQNAIRRDCVAHAYLFHGPDGVGKSAAALSFAQAINCSGEQAAATADACGECRACQLITRGNHPDVRIITTRRDPEGRERTEISIHQIRQDRRRPYETPRPLIQDAYLRPLLGRRKVYLIDPADRMSAEAANALLKVLEEPPPYVVLILVTSQASALLPTVVSRCQQVAFHPAGTEAIEKHLASLGLESARARALARLSGGRVAWAIRAAQWPEVLGVRKALLDLCARVESQQVPAGLRLADDIKQQALCLAQAKMARDVGEAGEQEEESDTFGRASVPTDRGLRVELPWCLDVMVSWYRDRVAAAQRGPLVNEDYREAICEGLGSHAARQAEIAIEAILAAKHQIQRNANLDLALESLAIRLLGGSE